MAAKACYNKRALCQWGGVLCFVGDLLKQVNALITYSHLQACILLLGHKRLYGESAQDTVTH